MPVSDPSSSRPLSSAPLLLTIPDRLQVQGTMSLPLGVGEVSSADEEEGVFHFNTNSGYSGYENGYYRLSW